MTRDEMMVAFRMIAMGRPSTPHVEQLADFLLALAPQEPEVPAVIAVEVPAAPEVEAVPEAVEPQPAPVAEPATVAPPAPAKRGRKAKAD